MRYARFKTAAVLGGLFALALLFFGLNVFIGSAKFSFGEAAARLLSGDAIMWKIRAPRAMAALLLGGALALSGYLLQVFFHNPIAGPFVLGVSSGAKLAVALLMITAAAAGRTLTSVSMVGAAFAGSMLSLGLILLISQRVGRVSLLVVCGVMIGYICSAATDFAVTFADDADIVNLRSWSMGSFSGTDIDSVAVMAVIVPAASICVFLLSKPIGAYRLGEGYAKSSGVRVGLLRAALMTLSGLLAACVTAFAGPVSFVGIAAPHIVRLLLGGSKPASLIPACFLGGGIFCSACDLIARLAFAPTELSISTVTAIFGAPVVIAVMLRRKRGEAV